MKRELMDYFYDHYENDRASYPDPISYLDVKRFMREIEDVNVRALIYEMGLHEISKSIAFDAIEKLG